jgi:glycosyltransferase involved in cell wall biosynthesis
VRIRLLISRLGDTTSGGTRYAAELARGLSKSGVHVSVATLFATESARAELARDEISVISRFESKKLPRPNPAAVTRLSGPGLALGRLASNQDPVDWYVLLSDDAISSVLELRKRKVAYVSQGAYPLLFLNPGFYHRNGMVKRLLSFDMAGAIRANGRCLSAFNLLLANSECCRTLMSFTYGVPFSGTIYPPVDVLRFSPSPQRPSADYALALARNESEYGISVLERLAQAIRLKIVGGARVIGAENLGVVDDTALIDLYRNAAFLAFPQVAEYFGYPVAEANACGTPVLAFSACGPMEQITNGTNGWLTHSRDGFLTLGQTLFREGIPDKSRTACRERAMRYDSRMVSRALIDILMASS